MLKRLKTLTRVLLQEEKAILRATSFIKRAIKEGIPQTIERLKHISNPKRRPDNSFYNYWLKNIHQPSKDEKLIMAKWAIELINPPKISILLPVYNSKPEWLLEAINSVFKQIYPHWELCIADDASTNPTIKKLLEKIATKDQRVKVIFRTDNGHISRCSNTALELASGEWLALLDHDDLLSDDALIWVAKTIINEPNAKLIYSDEDNFRLDHEHTNAYLKCDWDPLLAEGQNMFSHLGVFNAQLVRSIGGFRVGFEGSQDYDLLLRCVDKIDRNQIIHIPRILYHMRIHLQSSSLGAKPYAQFAAERALGDHLARKGNSGRVVSTHYGYRVVNSLTEKPLVSIIIPSRNKLELLRDCIESILSTTNYPHIEILIIDNGSDDVSCLAYLNEIKNNPIISVIKDPREFNYSALMNCAAKQAKGELLLLLNNDIVILHQDWLEEMVSQSLRPGIGAVGGKLLYPNGTVQHAGILLGIGGVAGYAHLGIAEHEGGYFRRAALVQEISAVTAAVLLVQAKHFHEVGGFDERNLSIAFNDVDFCLKLKAAGYHNVFTPFAQFVHHESASRGSDNTPENIDRFSAECAWMKHQWGELLLNDSAYNPNLSLEGHSQFNLALSPRLKSFSITSNNA